MSGNERNGKKDFVIPVTWEVYSTITVSANNLEEALDWAEKNQDALPLPTESEYVDASFQINSEIAGENLYRIGSNYYDADVDLEDDKELD